VLAPLQTVVAQAQQEGLPDSNAHMVAARKLIVVLVEEETVTKQLQVRAFVNHVVANVCQFEPFDLSFPRNFIASVFLFQAGTACESEIS
jgi:hypothetical protein